MFLLYGAAWGLAFAGFPYAIALKTGNPAAVNSSFLLFFPFAFLTTTFLPEEALTGWLATIAKYNPVTYVLRGLRSLISEGWVWQDLAEGLLAIGAVGVDQLRAGQRRAARQDRTAVEAFLSRSLSRLMRVRSIGDVQTTNASSEPRRPHHALPELPLP